MIDTPNVDWLALSPTLALLAASGVALLTAVLVPAWMRKTVGAVVAFAGFVVAAVFAGIVLDTTPTPTSLLSESMIRDELAGLAQLILAVTGAVVVFVSWSERRSENHARVLRAPHGCRCGDAVLRRGREPDDALPRARVVLALALHPVRARHRARDLARGRSQVRHRRRLRVGGAALRIRARATEPRARSASPRSPPQRRGTTSSWWLGSR